MAINFPPSPVLGELFVDIYGVQWECIGADAGDIQWARTGAITSIDVMPVGSVVAWTNAVIPDGWLECNGQATTGYADLIALIGATRLRSSMD